MTTENNTIKLAVTTFMHDEVHDSKTILVSPKKLHDSIVSSVSEKGITQATIQYKNALSASFYLPMKRLELRSISQSILRDVLNTMDVKQYLPEISNEKKTK